MPRPNRIKTKEEVEASRRAYAAKQDEAYGESRQIAAVEYEPSPVVPLPGPGFTPRRTGYSNSLGYPRDAPSVTCACAECKKAFEVQRTSYEDTYSHSTAYSDTVAGECPDCGAPFDFSLNTAGEQYYDATGKGGPFRIDIPVMRQAFASENGKRVTDTVSFKSVVASPVTEDAEGHKKVNFRVTGGIDKIEYTPGAIMASYTDVSGEKLAAAGVDPDRLASDAVKRGIRQGSVWGIPQEHENNKPRTEIAVPEVKHRSVQGSPWELPGTHLYPGGQQSTEDRNFLSAKYAAMAKAYGLPEPASEREFGRAPKMAQREAISSGDMRKVFEFCVQYPGVVEREMNRVNTNLQYHPEEAAVAARMRFDALTQTADIITASDKKLALDLHQCKDAAAVEGVLRGAVFGEVPEGFKTDKSNVPVKIHFDEASDEDKAGGKFLKKQYNINPYVTAANMRTCQKLGITDPNHIQQVFKIGKEGGYPHGIVTPFEDKAAVGFARMYKKTHPSTTDMIEQLYGEAGKQWLPDTIAMYGNQRFCKNVARTSADRDRGDYVDFVNQARRFFAGTEESGPRTQADFVKAEAFQRAFGDKTEAVAKLCWEEYQRQPEQEASPFKQCRNGQPLMEGRNVREIHDEMVWLGNQGGHQGENQVINYPDKLPERLNRTVDGWDFHLVRDTIELYDAGAASRTCIYSGHQYSVVSGSEYVVLMYNPEGSLQGIASIDSNSMKLQEIEGQGNTALPKELGGPYMQWKAECNLKSTQACEVQERSIGTHKATYGMVGDWHNGHAGARPIEHVEAPRDLYPSPDVILEQHAKVLEARAKLGQQAEGQIQEALGHAGAVNTQEQPEAQDEHPF